MQYFDYVVGFTDKTVIRRSCGTARSTGHWVVRCSQAADRSRVRER
jgi:hypothetical protein